MKKKPLFAATLVFALTAAATPSAMSAATGGGEPTTVVAQADSGSTHSDKFSEAMSNGKTAEETHGDNVATPKALPAVAGGVAVKEGAKWAGKQVAKGALSEAGKRLIGVL